MKKLASLLVLLACLCGGVAWYQWMSAGTLATTLQDTTKERDALRQRVADLERHERKLADEVATLRDAAPAQPASAPSSTGARTST